MPLPSPDMPEPAKSAYEEARAIAGLSPRGAAALLRLATEHLVNHLGASGKTIDDKIQDLVNKGLDPLVQQMLDSLRVIGNEQIHPGTIDLGDDPEMLPTLFAVMNEIVSERITKPNRIKALYESLPQPKLDGIAQREQRAKSQAIAAESSSAKSGPPKPPPPRMPGES